MGSLRDALKRTTANLRKKKEFNFGVTDPGMASDWGIGDIPVWFPTGNTLLDLRLGGGWPSGRFSEVFSESESVGKSTLAQTSLANIQRIGGIGIQIEQETAFDAPRFRVLGGNPDDLIRWSPPSVEDGFEFLNEFFQNMEEDEVLFKAPKLIVWDTIAGSSTRAEAAGDTFGDGMGKRPRVVSEAHRRYKDLLWKYNCHFMWVNQAYSQIGKKSHVPLYETPGGKAIKFYASIRLKMRRIGWLGQGKAKDSKEEASGILTLAETIKNKVAPPYKKTQLALYGPTGYDDVMTLAHFFLENGHGDMIEGKGHYKIHGVEKSVYWKDIGQTVKEHPDTYLAWREKAAELFLLPADRAVDPADGLVKRKERIGQSPKKKSKKKK